MVGKSPVAVLMAFCLVGAGLSACVYSGQGDPVSRSFAWFGYLNGDDIRASCGGGASDRLRLVYNAVYGEHVRAYDITPWSGAGLNQTHKMTTRVQTGVDLTKMSLGKGSSVTDAWKGDEAVVNLTGAQMADLRGALMQSGLNGPVADRNLASDHVYWLVVACLGGQMHFNAWAAEDDAFAKLTFDDLLFAWDPTGIPVRTVAEAERSRDRIDLRNNQGRQPFNVRPGPGGLQGLLRPFG